MEDTGIPSFRIPSLPHGSLMVHGFAGRADGRRGMWKKKMSVGHAPTPPDLNQRDTKHRDRRRSRSDLGLGGSINTARSP
ncbi:hypothetical protein CGCF415_v012650 [Colletotrichum fructicola]|uniref:Uncharacterized protein n=1 Tax=Colletotrichum fructicola (strain Nara gc5) TaxID=1213859 RepID=A0A7J6IM47_COLFN|nr:hypothetical protein CFRS1_v008591 [Colletotrichum fructicola]KAF4477830.1 hypothetical protein CGGC5_v013755 [Colletotrichum fructicola Nara gc5]KAF4883192.1 hypothetical protein CGCFRS4_v013813 [Colletotrichum fructicola]KAF4893585.1 hypothetical protein CGCF415_v012650 [Colletotrichum fructicola]KAF4931120.1 hypothetical protein CGCF245_v011345 [Colletotrichum fructicola]